MATAGGSVRAACTSDLNILVDALSGAEGELCTAVKL